MSLDEHDRHNASLEIEVTLPNGSIMKWYAMAASRAAAWSPYIYLGIEKRGTARNKRQRYLSYAVDG